MLPDLSHKFGQMFNMTVLSLKEPSDDWGTYPKSGSFDFTGEWDGVMGKVNNYTKTFGQKVVFLYFQVIRGEYPLSLSAWSLRPDRAPLMDFVEFLTDYDILMLTPQQPKVDFDIFFRPFTEKSWVLLFATFLIVALALALKLLIAKKTGHQHNMSSRVIHVFVMLFVVLVNAYYAGALTMFFSTEMKVSFESLKDVLGDPTWKLLIRKGLYFC